VISLICVLGTPGMTLITLAVAIECCHTIRDVVVAYISTGKLCDLHLLLCH